MYGYIHSNENIKHNIVPYASSQYERICQFVEKMWNICWNAARGIMWCKSGIMHLQFTKFEESSLNYCWVSTLFSNSYFCFKLLCSKNTSFIWNIQSNACILINVYLLWAGDSEMIEGSELQHTDYFSLHFQLRPVVNHFVNINVC